MTGQRDIERTLDAWFVDGPTMMPDRLFDAVLDQVGQTRQRPLARLTLRLREMNPRIRIYTVLAAALLVVVAALAFVGGGSTSPVSTSAPSSPPSDLPSSAASPGIPGELAAVWMGAHREIDGVDPDAGVSLEITDDATFAMTEAASSNSRLLRSQVTAVDGDSFQLVTTSDVRACSVGDTGEYGWSLSTSGRVLNVTRVSDACAARGLAVPGTYWLMDCPTADDNCLGPLDPGTYGSQFLDPFLPTGEAWTPRYGALAYTVPEGWINVNDWPESFGLRPSDAADGTSIAIVRDAVVPSDDDPCSETASRTVGGDAESIAAWVAAAAGVVATDPVALTIGGRDAWRVDVSMDPAWTNVCPLFGDGGPGRIMFVDRAAGEGFAAGLVRGQQDRYYLIDVGEGRALLVQVEALTAEDYDAFVDEATAIVESFELNPG